MSTTSPVPARQWQVLTSLWAVSYVAILTVEHAEQWQSKILWDGGEAVAVVAAIIGGSRERADLAKGGIVTGKICEPLRLGMPVLLVAPEGSDATAIVDGTGAGRSFRASQVEAMAKWLAGLASEPSRGRHQPPDAYSWPVLARRLDEILRHAIETGRRYGEQRLVPWRR